MKQQVARWQSPDYARIERVTAHDGVVSVSFRNGDCVSLPSGWLLAPGGAVPDWERVRWTLYDFSVPTSTGLYDVPWDRVRALTDPEFSRHMADEAALQAQRIGSRLQALRRQRGLSAKSLANRAGISPVSLSRIETGRHEVVLSTLERLLAAMGYSLHDVAGPFTDEEPSASQNSAPDIGEHERVTIEWSPAHDVR